jgi:hypothetical protein
MNNYDDGHPQAVESARLATAKGELHPMKLTPQTRKRLVELQADFDGLQERSDAVGLSLEERIEIINAKGALLDQARELTETARRKQ